MECQFLISGWCICPWLHDTWELWLHNLASTCRVLSEAAELLAISHSLLQPHRLFFYWAKVQSHQMYLPYLRPRLSTAKSFGWNLCYNIERKSLTRAKTTGLDREGTRFSNRRDKVPPSPPVSHREAIPNSMLEMARPPLMRRSSYWIGTFNACWSRDCNCTGNSP